jgi:hypothetical protein
MPNPLTTESAETAEVNINKKRAGHTVAGMGFKNKKNLCALCVLCGKSL